ncbi:MAG: hypothetical protein HDS50_02615 [Bacteroides sp.]|nr:hypothetical protein [Bacteroides sp.]
MPTKNSAPTGASLCETPAERVPLRFLGIFRILRFFRQWRSTGLQIRRAGRARPESSRVGKGAFAPAPRGHQASVFHPLPAAAGRGNGGGASPLLGLRSA